MEKCGAFSSEIPKIPPLQTNIYHRLLGTSYINWRRIYPFQLSQGTLYVCCSSRVLCPFLAELTALCNRSVNYNNLFPARKSQGRKCSKGFIFQTSHLTQCFFFSPHSAQTFCFAHDLCILFCILFHNPLHSHIHSLHNRQQLNVSLFCSSFLCIRFTGNKQGPRLHVGIQAMQQSVLPSHCDGEIEISIKCVLRFGLCLLSSPFVKEKVGYLLKFQKVDGIISKGTVRKYFIITEEKSFPSNAGKLTTIRTPLDPNKSPNMQHSVSYSTQVSDFAKLRKQFWSADIQPHALTEGPQEEDP